MPETQKTLANAKERTAETLDFSANCFALCPLDGRYSQIRDKFAFYFSEYALVKYRVKVEVNWLVFLIENLSDMSEILDSFDCDTYPDILSIYENFSMDSYKRIKEIEKVTNHDVKSVELFVGEKLKEIGFDDLVSFVHIGCTSEDITNCAYATMIKDAFNDVWMPAAQELINIISEIAISNAHVAMLAHTHGQPATPTTIGKEFAVFESRMRQSLTNLTTIKPRAKFNGATGNYSAISIAFPDKDWMKLSKSFIEDKLGLAFNPVTTQIENHDYICRIAKEITQFNNILLDLDRDMWLYISMEYFKQIPVKTEVGSSTMPHKVNPIRFENSEGNICISNAIFDAISNKLPISRMQRDLSDSTVQRNIGLGFGYSLQAIQQTIGGLKKVEVNQDKLSEELDNKWEVLAEPIQTLLRKYGKPDAYDRLKELTRGKDISKEIIQEYIKDLDISEEYKTTLLNLTPATYIGNAACIVDFELG